MIRRTQRAGIAVLAAVCFSAAAAPILSPNPPTRQFGDLAFAPPMRPRLVGTQGLQRPFVYPWRIVDRRARLFEPDTADPQAILFFDGGRLARTAGETPWLLLGGDPLGRDLFSRTLTGGRLSLGVAAVAVLLSLGIGAVVGAVAGFAGGRTDRLLTAVADFAVVLPLVYVVVTLRAAMPPVLEPWAVFWTMVGVMALATWPFPARGVRAIVAAERRRPYVEAACAAGAGPLRLLLRHLLPAAAGHLAIQGLLLFPALIFAEATLSFVGLGFAEPSTSWGVMLQDAAGVSALTQAPWLLAPAAAIVLTVVAVHLVIRRPSGAAAAEGALHGAHVTS